MNITPDTTLYLIDEERDELIVCKAIDFTYTELVKHLEADCRIDPVHIEPNGAGGWCVPEFADGYSQFESFYDAFGSVHRYYEVRSRTLYAWDICYTAADCRESLAYKMGAVQDMIDTLNNAGEGQ